MVSKPCEECYENIITCVDGSIGVQNINACEILFIDIAGFELKTLKIGYAVFFCTGISLQSHISLSDKHLEDALWWWKW